MHFFFHSLLLLLLSLLSTPHHGLCFFQALARILKDAYRELTTRLSIDISCLRPVTKCPSSDILKHLGYFRIFPGLVTLMPMVEAYESGVDIDKVV